MGNPAFNQPFATRLTSFMNRFEALVEREWIQAGYPFVTRHLRSALSSPASRGRDCAPSFLLFADCTWQIMQQFPCSFEFNEGFLIQLVRHSYWSQFGPSLFVTKLSHQGRALI